MILVTGAGGKTGKAVVKALSNVESVCALVYREAHVPALTALGVEEVVIGDLHNPDTIRAALQNVRCVYHICPNMNPDEVLIGHVVIDEARRAHTEHFVYHSVLHSQTEKMTHHWQKMRVEEMLFESGLPFTVLQPAAYMQNILLNWKNITEQGLLRVPYSVNSKFSFVHLDDIAEAAKIVLTEPNHRNAIYELAGTGPMSYAEMAEIFGRKLKRAVRAEKETIQDWKLRAGNIGEYAVENLAKMFDYYDQWGLPGNPNTLRWLLKREPTSFDAFVQQILKEHNGD